MDDFKAHQDLNNRGCEFGRTNRTQIKDVVKDMSDLQKRLDTILYILLAQLFAFVAAAFWFVANRTIP